MSASIHYRTMRLTIALDGHAPRHFPARLMFGYREEEGPWLSRLETAARDHAPPFELPHHLWVDGLADDEAPMQSLGDQARFERAEAGAK